MKVSWAEVLEDFVSLVYPKVCMSCGATLLKNEEHICTHCRYHLPRTNFHLDPENAVMKLFWGRVDVHAAAAFVAFSKGGNVQKLIHRMKYKGHKEIGVLLGTMYGSELSASPLFASAQVIVPVPLHPGKLKKRGYNQCDFFAEGLGKSMDIPFEPGNLCRTVASETQTRRSRFDRWKNTESVFRVKDAKQLEGKHILLIDDVITTGATLEACAAELLSIKATRVSIAAIAYTAIS